MSARSLNRNGWAYLSVYGPQGTLPGNDQVLAVNLDGSGTVEVFAHAHHYDSRYESSPFAVPSRDGARVLFGSEWTAGGPIYAYVAGMAP
jgi:hypothetical protein